MNRKIYIKSSVSSKLSRGKWIIIKKNDSYYRELNESAGTLWGLLQKPKTTQELIEGLISAYDIDEKSAKTDVTAFVKSYINQGLLEEV